MNELLRVFRAVADPTRFRVLKMLEVRPLCVCEVMAVLDMAQSTASKHLRILHDAGLVEAIPGGVWTVYRLPKLKSADVAAIRKMVKNAPATCETSRDAAKAVKADRNRICRQKIERQIKKGR